MNRTLIPKFCRRRRQNFGRYRREGGTNLIKLSAVKNIDLCAEIRLLRLFEAFADVADQNGNITMELVEIEKDLEISHNTLKKYLRQFKSAGILKYRLTGVFRLNPEVFDFTGRLTNGEIASLKVKYLDFLSD